MTPKQKQLVQGSFEKVLPIAETTAELFYSRLFEQNPSYKSLFKGDMQEQGQKLMAMLSTAVKGLDQLEALIPAIQDLGRRHVTYGVKDKDYNSVREALLWTLEQGLSEVGEAFNEGLKQAWAVVYTVLADTMKDAAAKAQHNSVRDALRA